MHIIAKRCRKSRFVMRFIPSFSAACVMLFWHSKTRQPAAYLVYLYGQAARARWKPVPFSLRLIADATGLSNNAVQTALGCLRRRQLIETSAAHPTAVPEHRVLRHWRTH